MDLHFIKISELKKGSLGQPNSIQIKLNDFNNYKDDLDQNQSFQNPVSNSSCDYLRIAFRNCGEIAFLASLNETLNVNYIFF